MLGWVELIKSFKTSDPGIKHLAKLDGSNTCVLIIDLQMMKIYVPY